MDLQHQDQLPSLLLALNQTHDNLGAIESPRTYSQSLHGPIDASSQAATLAFMYLSKRFEDVKQVLGVPTSDETLKFLSLMVILSRRDIHISSEDMTYLQSKAYLLTQPLELRLKLLEAFADFLRAEFNIQTRILLELVVRAKSLSPQDPQETLRTLRELFCMLNNEDASRLRGASTSLMELWKIHAEKEMSHEKTLRILGFFLETRTLILLLQNIFSHYQDRVREISLLHPWGQSDRARTLRKQMEVITIFE
jgi:hypothetical protein